MPQTIKKILLILPLSLFVFFQLYLVFIKNYQVLDYSHYMNEFPRPLTAADRQPPKLSQTFRTPRSLSRIDVMLGTYAEKPKDGAIQLGIYNNYNNKTCLFLKNAPANQVQDNRFQPFLIPRGKVPAGSYTLELRFLPGEGQERLAVWTSLKDSYPYGDFFVNGKPEIGDMTFRVYYRATLWQAKTRLLEKMPSLWLSKFWLIVGFCLAAASLNFLVYYLTRKFFYD